MTYPSIRSNVAKIANALRYQKGFTAPDAFVQAWKVVKAKIAMKAGKVAFSYIKKDGTLRPAVGGVAPDDPKKSSGHKYNPLYVRYFDVVAQGFRQFNAAQFAA